MKPTKTVTVDGVRYRVTGRTYDPTVLDINGPGLVGGRAILGTLADPDLKEKVVAGVRRAKECRRAASEYIRQQVEAGTAGLGN